MFIESMTGVSILTQLAFCKNLLLIVSSTSVSVFHFAVFIAEGVFWAALHLECLYEILWFKLNCIPSGGFNTSTVTLLFFPEHCT